VRSPLPRLVTTALVAFATACPIPRDADGTIERVQNGVLRVGSAYNPPWVVAPDSIGGIEPRIVDGLARQLNASVRFVSGSETRLLESLHRRELSLVIGQFTDDSPWRGEGQFSKPYQEDGDGKKHVVALPPGENAWLVRVEKYLHEIESRK